jgi:hypothetical protein
MYGKIDILPQQRFFNFFHEEPFAPKLGQWITPIFIPRGPNDNYLYSDIRMMYP